jgi:predicted restriction endonuclease
VFGFTGIRTLALNPLSQHSIRPVDPLLLDELFDRLGHTRLARFESRRKTAQGFTIVTVRARVGQGRFREQLLEQFDRVCAITGRAPEEALEAAHLYSYAELGEHHEDGGLLLRRDVHRLFDLGLISINPRSLKVQVASALHEYQMYKSIHNSPVHVALSSSHLEWISSHFKQATL